jgi:hypothetical protein
LSEGLHCLGDAVEGRGLGGGGVLLTNKLACYMVIALGDGGIGPTRALA